MDINCASKQVASHIIGVTLCVLLAACSKTPQAIQELPELPADLAKDLVAARTAPVLMTGSLAGPVKTPPPATTPPVAHAPPRACTTSWDGYVIYPMTVCHAPPFTDLVLAKQSAAERKIPGVDKLEEAKFYKLSSHPKSKIKSLLFCSVRGGPWFAHVEGKQLCNVDPNFRTFTAEILGGPEPVAVSWSGALSDVPPPLLLAAITESGVACTCCSGVTCPDGSCKPNFNMCGVMPPQ